MSVYQLIGILLILVSLYLFWKFISFNQLKKASQNWPVAQGKVDSKEVTLRRSDKGGSWYFPTLMVSYQVLGADYQRKIMLDRKATRQSADAALQAIGDTMEIRYDSQKPSNYFSELSKPPVVNIFFGLAALALGVMLVGGILG